MRTKFRTAIVAATTASAIVLFEILPFPSWEYTMAVMTPFRSYSNNYNYFLYPQSLEGDRKYIIAAISASSFITSKDKTIHSSFRIEEAVIKSLESAAEKRGISLSSLVNRILKNYVTSEMYFEELGFILVSKNFLRKTFDGLSGNQIQDLGKEYGLTIAREYITYFYPQVSSTTLIQFLDLWFKRFQSSQHRLDDANNKRHCYTVNHDINLNFSLALQSILEGLIEPIIKSVVEFTSITSTSITFSFES